jgi:transposase
VCWEWTILPSAGASVTGLSSARGIERDRSAVVAALSLEWSNGPTEGHVGRLKFLKRQGYGRASFELLRARVLERAA